MITEQNEQDMSVFWKVLDSIIELTQSEEGVDLNEQSIDNRNESPDLIW